MNSSDLPVIDNFMLKFNTIIQNYKVIKKNIINIGDDIKKLDNIHHIYITSDQVDLLNYSTYVDDIKHQINIIRIEFDYISNMYQLNLNKLYRDLFKLYNKIIKNLINIFRENKDIVIRIWNSNDKFSDESSDFRKLKKAIKTIADATRTGGIFATDSKIFEEIKKSYYLQIRIYDEMDTDQVYNVDDLNVIYREVEARITELNLSRELIKINLNDLIRKTDSGVLGQTFIMDLNGKIDRIKIDYSILTKLLESILSIHQTLSMKYRNLSHVIASTVAYDEDANTGSVKTPDTLKDKNDILEIFEMQNDEDINKFDDEH